MNPNREPEVRDPSSDKPGFSRIRVTPSTAEVFRVFQERHEADADEAIVGLVDFYDSHTQYRFSAETGHLLSDIRKLDASIVALVNANMQLMELQRAREHANLSTIANVMKALAAKV